ncbi:MAG: FecR family protein [Elusimicrobia bacterium]|nr:FecR family protein [Elusimicrobiota bacterium]
MKVRGVKLLVAGALVSGLCASAFCAGSLSAVVVFVKGDVQVKRAGEKEYAEIKVNDMLNSGDGIKTGAASQASVVTKGGAEVRLNENSNFEISPKGKLREVINLAVGQVWTKMLHKMAKLNVRTPSAVCAVRGTEADIEQRDLLTVKVYEGHVDVGNALGKQELKAGQMTTVAGANAAPGAAKQMSGGDMGKWQEEISVKDYDKFSKLLKDRSESEKKLKVDITKGSQTKEVDIKLKKK